MGERLLEQFGIVEAVVQRRLEPALRLVQSDRSCIARARYDERATGSATYDDRLIEVHDK